MKRVKFTLAAKFSALVFASGICATASAAVVQGVSLGAMEVVNAFNGLNNGTGLHFRLEGSGHIFRVFNVGDPYYVSLAGGTVYDFVDLGGYTRDPSTLLQVFTTFGAAVSLTVNASAGTGTAKLNYNPYSGSTSTQYSPSLTNYNTTLSVGAAYMYTMYATEGMYGGPYANRGDNMSPSFYDAWATLTNQDRIRLPLGVSMWDDKNPYLQSLLSVNSDKSYWLSVYDPDKLYSEIGYYSVFTMVLKDSSGKDMKNMLYLADMHPAVIPEPETWAMMLLGLGMVGGLARRRKTR
jgi:hypothetical protein